jgi:hypothetical protein
VTALQSEEWRESRRPHGHCRQKRTAEIDPFIATGLRHARIGQV